MKQTGLHIVAKTNNREMLKILMSNKSFINATDLLNRTPLLLAASQNYKGMTIVILQLITIRN